MTAERNSGKHSLQKVNRCKTFKSAFMPPVRLMNVCIKKVEAVGALGSCLKMYGQEAPEIKGENTKKS